MRVGTISRLWRHPVKSMGGERMESAALSWRGIPGDRGWAVYDESRGGITNAKRLPLLRGCRARYPGDPVAGAASPPAGSDTAPRQTLEGESAETVRELMGILPDEPMPDMSAFPPERLRLLRQGNYFDALPIHLLTRTTLNTLARLAPESAWDERRFRPNLFVDAEDPDGYPEIGWIGRRLRVGTAVIEVVTGCPRCVMVTQPVDDLPQDHRVMRTLVRETKHTAGIYARVVEEGEVRVGDGVEVLK